MSAELARAGDLEALSALESRTAYKWLSAAYDFGHAGAEFAIDDLLDLRFDDDGYERAAAHWELAAAYLQGSDGLSVDLVLAKRHLRRAFEQGSLDEINAGAKTQYDAQALLARLPDDAKKLLATELAGGDVYDRIIELTERCRRLDELSAPPIMVQAERDRLMQQVQRLLAKPCV